MNDVPLRDLIESEIRRVEAQISSLARSVDKSEKLLNKRLEGMNEFREALKDQAGQMATREQLRMVQERLEDRLGVQDKQISDLKQQQSRILGGAAVLAALISLAGLAMRYVFA